MFRQKTAASRSVLLIPFLLASSWSGGGVSSSDNEFVKVEVSLADTLLRPGGTGSILISFTPLEGIHVNVDPPVSVHVPKSQCISLRGKPDFSADKETGFLSTSAPVEQAFSVSRKAAAGVRTVKGTIIYYFCSDTEGWCRKQSQAVTLTLTIQGP